ncbi:MAG: hypothetical protein NTW49_08975 [Bacteroidia bacterium]|nr:hypothetical protein [Bacteroidia bacterium]
MKTTFILIVLLANVLFSDAQEYSGHPQIKGAFRSFEEFKNNKPSTIFDFKVKYRSGFSIFMVGGNDIKIISLNNNISSYNIKKEFWGICDGDTIYINNYLFSKNLWYSKLNKIGRVCLFTGAYPSTPQLAQKLAMSAFMFGAIGAGIYGGTMATKRVGYVLDNKTGDVIMLTRENVAELLKENQELFDEYNKEEDMDDVEMMFKYLEKYYND